MSDTSGHIRVVVYYAVWATICAAVAGIAVTILHAAFFSFNPGRSAVVETVVSGLVTSLAIAAGQGAVALVTGSLLARLGRGLNFTVLLGLALGLFDFVMYTLQMAVPVTELGWVPDIAILVGVTIAITLSGTRRAASAAP
jgi:hypothetical protein